MNTAAGALSKTSFTDSMWAAHAFHFCLSSSDTALRAHGKMPWTECSFVPKQHCAMSLPDILRTSLLSRVRRRDTCIELDSNVQRE